MKVLLKVVLMSIVLVILILCGCHASQKHAVDREMSKSEALILAVSLANKECDLQYLSAPFDTASYAIEYREGLWHWGTLNPHGINGYSAIVSFDAKGASRSVEVFFSTDALTPGITREADKKDKK